MNRGKGKPTSTFRDAAQDFLSKWQASKPETTQPASDNRSDKPKNGIEQTLRSWKRGGGEVKVSSGTSTGREARKPKAAVHPRRNHHQEVRASLPMVGKAAPPTPPKTQPTPTVETTRQRLKSASADLGRLRISAAASRPCDLSELAPVTEDHSGRLAILGLDFGTAFTKAVVRWSGRHFAVNWGNAVEGEDDHLLASVFSESSDGLCVLGACSETGWSVRDGIKLRLLSADPTATDGPMADAVIFVALAFRYVSGWLRAASHDADQKVRWRLHLGLPTKSWDSDATTERFKSVAQAARLLALMPGPITRAAALQALSKSEAVLRPAVDVFPEFACQLYSYLESSERSEDLHALVDIGAGTLDVAYFNVFMKGEEALLPIFASEVEQLGAHYLIAALAGTDGAGTWTDGESSLSDEEVGQKLTCRASEVAARRSLYLCSVSDVFNETTQAARKAYPTSPAFRGTERVRLFLCGGGSRIPSIRQRFNRIAREAAALLGIAFEVSELVKPRDLSGEVAPSFDRLSVAYGLSQLAGNIGNVMRSAMLSPLAPRERNTDKHRDDDR